MKSQAINRAVSPTFKQKCSVVHDDNLSVLVPERSARAVPDREIRPSLEKESSLPPGTLTTVRRRMAQASHIQSKFAVRQDLGLQHARRPLSRSRLEERRKSESQLLSAVLFS